MIASNWSIVIVRFMIRKCNHGGTMGKPLLNS